MQLKNIFGYCILAIEFPISAPILCGSPLTVIYLVIKVILLYVLLI